MPRSNYPFLAKNQKMEDQRRKEEIELRWKQMGVIGPTNRSFFTGYGEDGVLQPNKPTHMLGTNVGQRPVHEGEEVRVKPDGGLHVTPAEQFGGQQRLQQTSERMGVRGFQVPQYDMSGRLIDTDKPATQVTASPEGTNLTGELASFTPPTQIAPTQREGSSIGVQTPSFTPPTQILPVQREGTAIGYPTPAESEATERSAYQKYLDSLGQQSEATEQSAYQTYLAQKEREEAAPAPFNTAGYYANAPTGGQGDPITTPSTFAEGARLATATGQPATVVGAPGEREYAPTGPGVVGGAPSTTIPPTDVTAPPEVAQVSPYEEAQRRGIQRLERYADFESPRERAIREAERERFAGEAAARQGSMAQELAQAGITGREASIEQAMAKRQVGAEESALMADLRKQEADRAFQAAGQVPGEARAARTFEEGVRQFDVVQGNWEKNFGVTQANQMATDAGTMTKDTWLAKYEGQGVTGADYDLAHAASPFGQTKWERNMTAFNTQIAAGNFGEDTIATWNEMFPDIPLDLTKLKTEESRANFATGMSNMAAYIASGLSYEDALVAMKQDGTFENLGLDEGAVEKIYDKMLLNSDPVYQRMSSLDDSTLKMMFPDMEPDAARALVGRMSIFNLMTIDENGQLTVDTEGIAQLFGEGFLGKQGQTVSRFGVYDSDGNLLSPEFGSEAEANTWKFNHPEISGLSVMTTGATGGTTGSTIGGATGGTTEGSADIPTTSLNVADKIGELTGQKNRLLDDSGSIPFISNTGAADYTAALAYVKVDDGDKKQFATTEPADDDIVDYMKSITTGNKPVFQLDKYEKLADEVAKFSSWIQSNYGKYINIGGKYYIVGDLSHVGSSGVGPQGTEPTDTLTVYSLNDGQPITMSYTVGTNPLAI